MADDDGGSDNHSRPETKSFKKDELKAKKKAFLTRKECIKKKTMELSVLCDVKACAVIIGPDGKIETWPENRNDVREMVDLYKKDCLNNKKRKQQHGDHGCKKKRVLGRDEGVLEDFLKRLEDKLDQVKKRKKEVKSKNQETDSASEIGNPLSGGIPPNAWPPKSSQNLGSHSNVGMLGFGNQLPGNIMSSNPGYFGGFTGNVDGMHLGPVVSSAPMSQLGFQSEQYLPSSLQLQSSNEASFSTTQSFHMPYSQAPQLQPQIQYNAPSAPQQGHVMENLWQIPSQQFQPVNEALSKFAHMLSKQKQTQQASFQSSQQAFSQLQQQLQMPQTSNCATAPSWFETESTVTAGVKGFQQNYIDNSDDSFWIESPIFQETSSSNLTMETPSCFDYQLDEIHGFEQGRQIPLSFHEYGTEFELPSIENDSNYIDCATAPSWFETESTATAGVKGFQQNYIDNSDDSFWIESPIFQETSSFNQTVETPCFFDYQVDEMHGFEQARQSPLSFDRCGTGFELPDIENDSNYIDCATAPSWFETENTAKARVKGSQQNYIDNSDDSFWTESPIFQKTSSFNQTTERPCFFDYQDEIHGFEQVRQSPLSIDQCGAGFELDTGLELPPTQPSPRSSCFSDTTTTFGEENELAVLLQQLQQTAPTLNSFNPDFGLTDTLGFPSNVTVQ